MIYAMLLIQINHKYMQREDISNVLLPGEWQDTLDAFGQWCIDQDIDRHSQDEVSDEMLAEFKLRFL